MQGPWESARRRRRGAGAQEPEFPRTSGKNSRKRRSPEEEKRKGDSGNCQRGGGPALLSTRPAALIYVPAVPVVQYLNGRVSWIPLWDVLGPPPSCSGYQAQLRTAS